MFQVAGSIKVYDDMKQGEIFGILEFTDTKSGSMFVISNERGTHRVKYEDMLKQSADSVVYDDTTEKLTMTFDKINIQVNNKKLNSKVEVIIPNAQILCVFLRRLGFVITEPKYDN